MSVCVCVCVCVVLCVFVTHSQCLDMDISMLAYLAGGHVYKYACISRRYI
jgi:hypothetical protein